MLTAEIGWFVAGAAFEVRPHFGSSSHSRSEDWRKVPLTRRELLKGLGLAVGGLGLSAAGYEHLVPFIHQPENVVPGESTWFATSCRECPAGCGMLVRTREARAVKVEGNPVHPISGGRLCARGQASVQGLYDPDRIKGPLRRRDSDFEPVAWKDALDAVGGILRKRPRIACLSTLETGSLDSLMRAWLSALGADRFIIYEPVSYEPVKAASAVAAGRAVVPTFKINGSDYLISFAADFLETWVSPVEYARQFAVMREIKGGARGRFAYVGPRVSMTAANADERVLVPPGAETAVALAVVSELGGAVPAGFSAEAVGRQFDLDSEQIRRIARGLRAAKAPLALPGRDADTARAAMLLNGVLASPQINFGRPHAVTDIAPRSDVTSLTADMERGSIDVLIVYGANPVYSLPAADRFVEALKRVRTVVSLSSFMDETTALAHWVLPSNTPLESWGDHTPYPDITNLMQPAMGALYDTRQTGDILIELARAAGLDPGMTFKATTYYQYLRLHSGAPIGPGEGPETLAPQWEGMVQIGGRWPGAPSPVIESIVAADSRPATVSGTAASPAGPILSPNGAPVPAGAPAPSGTPSPAATAGGGGGAAAFPIGSVKPPAPNRELLLHAYPHIYLYDGRGANRGWLQELPEPMTKAVWCTWAEMHPATARKLGVNDEDVIRIEHGGARIDAPVRVWPAAAPGTVAVPIGQGHTAYGRFAEGTGANVLPLLDTANPPVKLTKTGRTQEITHRRGSTRQYGRDIAQTVVLGEPVRRGQIVMPLPSGYKFNDFYGGHAHPMHRWAMVVDMDRCIGCHACVAACYAENNVAVVGPENVRRRRDMQWIRIDPYIDWGQRSAPVIFQPMLCQHCDAAPCEPVCPVFAAAHDEEGLNMQIYNRCVGTRYCSNNCPYKVRRFNWYDYDWPEPLNWQLNPDVTVRRRGVMEKCTFCVQRIRQAEIVALRERRGMRDGEVIPACTETCPTGVFTFGDLVDPNSRVSKIIRGDPRAYQVLQSLNTKTAVIYLKRVVEKA